MNVRRLRMRLGLSQRELAAALSVAPFTVLRWENGRSPPTGLALIVLSAIEEASVLKTKREQVVRRLRLGVGWLVARALA